MDQHQWLVFILLPLVWSISLKQVECARPLQTHTSQKNTWPWYSILPPIGQPLLSGPTLPNLLNFTLPSPPPPPPFSFPKFALPPFPAPKFPSIPPISQPILSFPPFSQPKPTLPSVPPSSLPGKPDKSPGWQLSLPPLPQPTLPKFPAWGPSSWSTPSPPPPGPPPPATPSFPWNNPTPPLPTSPSFPWNNPTPPLPTIPSLPWNTPSPPPPTTPSFPWNNPTPPLPTTPSFPWNTPSPPPPSTPSSPWDNPSPSPPLPTIPLLPWNTPPPPASFPWNNPSPPPSLTTPTIPTIPAIPTLPIIPSLPWNTPSPPPTTPAFPWLASPPPTIPTLPWLTPPSPPAVIGSTLPPFGLPPGGPFFPTGIQFTFSNFTNSWLPEAGVKVTWESVITIELSLQLLVEALFKPITLIIQQFESSSGPGSWGWKNGLTESKFSADVGATCTTLGKNGFPEKGLIVVQTPIDNTIDTAITWFIVLFNGWSETTPFNATLDHAPGTFGGFVTNVTNPNLKTFCSHPGALNRVAAKQGQYVLN